jgi:hypothetical protein
MRYRPPCAKGPASATDKRIAVIGSGIRGRAAANTPHIGHEGILDEPVSRLIAAVTSAPVQAPSVQAAGRRKGFTTEAI